MGVVRVSFREHPCAATSSTPATCIDPGTTCVAQNTHKALGGNGGVNGDPTAGKTYAACRDRREAAGESAVTKVSEAPETHSGERGVDEDAVGEGEALGDEAAKDEKEIGVEEPPREDAKPACLFGRGRDWRSYGDA